MPSSRIVRGNGHLPPWAVIPLVAWSTSLPWAILHGPVSPLWVVSQALGAGIIPAAVGGVGLWARHGDVKGAVRVTVGASALLLACLIWSQVRG